MTNEHPAADALRAAGFGPEDNAAEREREDAQAAALLRLRELRVWHWRELLKARRMAARVPSGQMAMRYHEEANTHLGFVQSLNDFFPMGDTAERDAEGIAHAAHKAATR